MSTASTHAATLLSAHGRLAMRLARAIVGDDETARLVVRQSAETCDDPDDWLCFLAAVRRESLCRSSPVGADRHSEPPAPRHPGDVPTGGLPVDAALLHEALFSLSHTDRTTLWAALVGDAEGTDPGQLAGALARLHEAVARTSFPSAEDIP